MFSKVLLPFFALFSFLAMFAAATSTITVTSQNPVPTTISQCNTGDAQCCNTVETANTLGLGTLLALLGIAINPVTALVGLGCTPITIIGGGQGADCSQHPVCCQNNEFQGLINIGCVPISL